MGNKKILDFIELCKSIWGEYPKFSGGCYKFSKLLISVFGGQMYWTHDHVVTVIKGVAYDKNGVFELTEDFISAQGHEKFLERIYSEYL